MYQIWIASYGGFRMTDKSVGKESFVDHALRVLDEIELKEKGKRTEVSWFWQSIGHPLHRRYAMAASSAQLFLATISVRNVDGTFKGEENYDG